MPMTKSREDYPGNVRLAQAIRKVNELHQASYVGDEAYKANPHRPYAKSIHDCIHEVVGDDPIATILACLFTAGFADMYDFCDTVLGPQAPTQEDKA